MKLSELPTGHSGIIVKVLGHGAFRKRVMEMGFVRGQRVEVILNAPLKDPIVYKVMGYEVSLRASEASMVEVIEQDPTMPIPDPATPLEELSEIVLRHLPDPEARTINVALVGNPNCGKSSLFNAASGSRQHVGNYSGVTVDATRGHFVHGGYRIVLYDLPGTYALSAYSPEERFVRQHLVDNPPDVIVNVVAASNLERNLYLTTELIDMDQRLVVALNMYDELVVSGARLDYKELGEMLGVPFVPTVSRTGKGIKALFDTVIKVFENREQSVRHIHINHGHPIEEGIEQIKEVIKADPSLDKNYSPRYLAIKFLEGDPEVEKYLKQEGCYPAGERERAARHIKSELGEDPQSAITGAKYGFIAGALRETYTPAAVEEKQTTRAIDALVTNKVIGFPVFLLLMWIMFEATFIVGAYPMEWIEAGVGWLARMVGEWMNPGPLRDLIVDGVIGGVGGVIVFLPNILILYFFISFMEDSGYMARAAFIMDKIMHRLGLHGKSFIPLIMGFGCNVPAIMASRTIESHSSRIITVLINPFISCSARLPVYLLLAGVFFPDHAGLVLIGLYVFGIVVAAITARLLRKFFFKKDQTPFVMELPPYRMPTLKATARHMWDKAAQYLRKMGGIILVASVLVWFLSYFPRPAASPETPAAHSMENSYLGRVGQWIQPATAPLGFNWKANVALLSGTAAKEVIVSTMGVLYTGDGDHTEVLSKRIAAPDPVTDKPDFTPVIALAFMVFVLLYFPCVASLAAIATETGSWWWALFSVIYNTFVAWLAAFAVFQIGSMWW